MLVLAKESMNEWNNLEPRAILGFCTGRHATHDLGMVQSSTSPSRLGIQGLVGRHARKGIGFFVYCWLLDSGRSSASKGGKGVALLGSGIHQLEFLQERRAEGFGDLILGIVVLVGIIVYVCKQGIR